MPTGYPGMMMLNFFPLWFYMCIGKWLDAFIKNTAWLNGVKDVFVLF